MALVQTTSPLTPFPDPRRVQQAITRLKALPAFYPTVQKALRLLDDPLASSAQLQAVLQTDQAVASRILQLANSAYFGFYSQVRTVSLAISLIGREKISTLLHRFLVEELIQMLSGRKPAARQIREMSLVTAAAAHMMAERLVRHDKEEILIAGLLHNIGELVYLSQFRTEYEEMLRLASRTSRSEAEQAIFGVESSLAGKWLLEGWSFPPFFPTIIEHCRNPWRAPLSDIPLAAVALVHAGRCLAESWIRGDQPEETCRWISPRLLSTLEVDQAFLMDVSQELPRGVEQLKSALA